MTEKSMDQKQVFCQSCGMPLTEEAQLGTEADGSRSGEYCCYCYEKGAFAQDCTMEEMIEFCLKLNDEHGAMGTREEAKATMEQWFPTLKRWKECQPAVKG